MIRKIRILILLCLLAAVSLNAWLDRSHSRDWSRPLRVAVYPINGDGSQVAARYIAGLAREDFTPMETYLLREAKRYRTDIRQPVDIRLAPAVDSLPPSPPRNGGVLENMWWSLRLRYWAFRVDDYEGPVPQVRMFVLYFDPRRHPRLAHSVGLEKGLLGVVNAFASRRMAGRNRVVITHELLHTVGATDKYDPRTNLPLYPQGYADPSRHPLHPQRRAEIMAGRIPLTADRAVIPPDLSRTMIGPLTAREIGWLSD